MASRKPYECFKCRDHGFPNTMVYLAGKDEQGKTIYIKEDGTAHRHKTIDQGQTASANAVLTTENTAIKIINAKLDRIIDILAESRQIES